MIYIERSKLPEIIIIQSGEWKEGRGIEKYSY
jgi:hypothetical protein